MKVAVDTANHTLNVGPREVNNSVALLAILWVGVGMSTAYVVSMRDFRQKEKKRSCLKTNRAVTSPACPGVIPRPWLDQPIHGTWRL